MGGTQDAEALYVKGLFGDGRHCKMCVLQRSCSIWKVMGKVKPRCKEAIMGTQMEDGGPALSPS